MVSIEQKKKEGCVKKHAADLAAAGVGGRQLGGVLGEDRVEHAKVDAHVAQALRTQRARIVVARVLPEAVAVHEVPAGQLLHRRLSQLTRMLTSQVRRVMQGEGLPDKMPKDSGA